MNKEEKNNTETILKHERTLIDTIYNACAQNSKNFEVDFVPVIFLKMLCDTALGGLNRSLDASAKLLADKERGAIRKMQRLNKTLLDAIQNDCAKSAKNFHVDYVPVKFLKNTCDIAYETLKKGLIGN